MAHCLRKCLLWQIQTNNYVSPVIESQLFIIMTAFLDRFTLLIPIRIIGSISLISCSHEQYIYVYMYIYRIYPKFQIHVEARVSISYK